uniref:Uncharacterized protein n=1 Tax=CrAss-like virus sp. ctt4r3 TaxID=2823619 RepID=A0A8S5L7F7_9CAUD|nr:MAG TPA: hypothetical protein [CrAss-like virus sp. ctt4r3]
MHENLQDNGRINTIFIHYIIYLCLCNVIQL